MRRVGCLFLTVCFLAPVAYGQSVNTVSTVHVFPQAAAGTFADGSSFGSLIWIYNTGSVNAVCSLSGPMASRFVDGAATVQSNFVSTMTAPRQGSFANGFVVLNCSQPVQASLTYFYWAADGHLIGMATVLSARAILSSALTVYDFLGRYGIAIANPGSTTLSLTIQLDTATSSIQRQVSLLPNSQIVGFADELLNISPTIGQAAVLTIRSNSQDRFYTTGLLFNGSAFTTLVPGADVAATPTGGSTSSDPCAALAGASIVASDGQFLGKISSDRYNSQSISNQFGNYGSPFSSTSIFNSVGTYGSTVSSKSAFNEVASTPPVVIGANGQSLGFLTVNSVKTPGINTWTVVACVQPSRDAL